MSSSHVVHLSPQLHTLVKQYCQRHGLQMKDLISRLLEQHLATEKKDKPVTVRGPPGYNPWTRPPFWVGKR